MTKNIFALKLLDWHGGMWTGIYAVGSSLLAGNYPQFDSMVKAIRELRHENNSECAKLANTLQLMLECEGVYCATYQKWQEKDCL